MEIYLTQLFALFNEIAPFLILGFFISGVLSVVLTVEFISRYLGGKSYSSVFIASILGVPLPLCSCGVIPVTAFLRKHGASRASSTSFLISTPQTGVDSIMVSYSLLGPLIAIYRPILAFISGIIGGSLVHFLKSKENISYQDSQCEDDCCVDPISNSKILRALHYGFVRLPIDIISPLLVGLVLSAFISILIPENYFINYGSGIVGMLVMLILSLPTYICATASVPLAFVFYTKGFSMGAILVFLMAGPATNITTITVTLKILGKKVTSIYMISIIGCSIAGGLLLDYISPEINIFASDYHVHMNDGYIASICSLILFCIILNSIRLKYFTTESAVLNSNAEYKVINVKGMTCSHCEDSVKKSLLKLETVNAVEADAKTGVVTVEYEGDIDIKKILNVIEELGFKEVENEK